LQREREEMQLDGKVALVTGAGRGIGKEIALKLAAHGADVAVSDILAEAVEATAAAVRETGRKSLALVCDVSKLADVEALIERIIDELKRIDILVNNAGITSDQLLMRMSETDWDKVIAVNLKGVFNCCKAAIRHMLKQRGGRIINISSIVGMIGNAGQTNYAASKAGIIGFTKALAKEVASRGICVNAIAPGFIRTHMTEALPEEIKNQLLGQIPMKRIGEPEDVANLVLFLASEAASYITGEVIRVDGGMAM
jgi:3-oxoacyl-[acyl-carrier protein] reductase